MRTSDGWARCGRCGLEFSAGKTGGLCPACLLGGLLDKGAAPVESREGVDGYELIEVIGEGGMGVVWRARQYEPVEREVALKVIKLGLDTREVVARFRQEQQSLALMDHPAIARVFGAGETRDGRPFFVMELVRGLPVTEFCEVKELGMVARLELFLRLTAAVEHAHQKGIIHRDLKPSNVLVEAAEGEAKLKVIDFGVAKAMEPDWGGETVRTLAGQVVGTPGYMSPEQARGERDLDTRTDVYGLGAILYELLTGEAPLSRETLRDAAMAEVVRLISDSEPVRPSLRNRGARMVKELDWVVLKALARERSRRYGTATSLGEDVRRFLNHEPVSAVAPSVFYLAGKFARKHRLLVSSALSIVLMLATGLVVTGMMAKRAREAARREALAKDEAHASLADALRDRGLREAQDGNHGLAGLWFTRASVLAAQDARRREANLARAAYAFGRAPKPLRFIEFASRGDELFLRFDESDRYLLKGAWPHSYEVFDLENGRALAFGKESPVLRAAAFLTGRGEVAVGSGEGVEIWNLDKREMVTSFKIGDDAVGSIWSDGAGRMILVQAGGETRLWDRESEDFVGGVIAHPGVIKWADFSEDAGLFLTADEGRLLRVFRTGGSEPLFEPMDGIGRGGEFYSRLPPRFLDEGGRIASCRGEQFVVLDAQSGRILHSSPWKSGNGVTGDGRLVAKSDGVMEIETGGLILSESLGSARFSPDGRLVHGDLAGKLWSLEGTVANSFPFPAFSQAFSKDGNLFAQAEPEGILVYRMDEANGLSAIPCLFSQAAVFSGNGRYLAPGGASHFANRVTRTAVYDLEAGRWAGPVMETESPVTASLFVPGERLIAGCGTRDGDLNEAPPADLGSTGFLQLWDWREGRRLVERLELPSEPRAMALHPDKSWLAVQCFGGEICRVAPDLSRMEILFTRATDSVETGFDQVNGSIAFSSDGQRLYASCSDRRTDLLDASTGQPLAPRLEHGRVASRMEVKDSVLFTAVAEDPERWFHDAVTGGKLPNKLGEGIPAWPYGSRLSDDGNLLLASGMGQAVVVDWRTGQMRGAPFRPEGIEKPIYSEFIPGCDWVLSCHCDQQLFNTMSVWDPATGLLVAGPWNLGRGHLLDLRVTPDGKRAVATIEWVGFVVLDLKEMLVPVARERALPPAGRMARAEIRSGFRIVNGTPVRFTDAGQWAKAWKAETGKTGQPPLPDSWAGWNWVNQNWLASRGSYGADWWDKRRQRWLEEDQSSR